MSTSQLFDLELWYQRWLILQKWKYKLSSHSEKARKEIISAYERHAVTTLCYYGSNWFYCSDFSKVKKEIEDLWRSGTIELTDVRLVRIGLIDVIRSFRTVSFAPGGMDVSPEDAHAVAVSPLVYKDFKMTCGKDLLESLSEQGSPVEITTMMLRYECLCPGGQQWAVPKEWLTNIAAGRGLDFIAFSSPLNRQVNVPYCSAYAEDRKFGSMGSIFDIQPEYCDTYAGKNFTFEMNPPFIERILSDSVSFVERFVKYAKKMKNPPNMMILFIGPKWEDAEYYSRIKKLSAETIKLSAGRYTYEIGTTGKKIKTSKDSMLFVVVTGKSKGNVDMKGFVN